MIGPGSYKNDVMSHSIASKVEDHDPGPLAGLCATYQVKEGSGKKSGIGDIDYRYINIIELFPFMI